MAPGTSFIRPEPLGVALVMGAWNFPILTLINAVIDAMAAGNSVVLKPSELAPHTSMAVEKALTPVLDQRFYRVVQGKATIAKCLTQ